MSARIIDGKKIAAEIRAEVQAATRRLISEQNLTPGLAFILVGHHPASESYVRSKEKACAEMGFRTVTEKLSEDIVEQQLLDAVARFNEDSTYHGILIQLPLPKHIREDRVISAIDPAKDVDGFHPINVGKLMLGQPCLQPCTPAGIRELLIRSGIDPSGKHVVIVGRSNIVGKPLAAILMQKQQGANATVTVVHSATNNIADYTRQADIIVAAIGQAEFIRGEMIKPGATVIDVGINRIVDAASPTGSRLTGDVHFESTSRVASAITPVPGGVGPMTIAMLMRNTLQAARREFR